MKEAQGDAVLFRRLRKLRLGDIELPVRGEVAAVFVAVRIADHHLLLISAQRHIAPINRIGQQRLQHLRGILQIFDRFEEWHDIHLGAAAVTGELGQACFFCQQQNGQNIRDSGCHRENTRPKRLSTQCLSLIGNEPEQRQCLVCFVVVLQVRGNQGPMSGNLFFQQCDFCTLVHLGIVNALRTEHCRERRKVFVFVFSNIQTGEMEAKQTCLDDQRGQSPPGGEVAFVCLQ